MINRIRLLRYAFGVAYLSLGMGFLMAMFSHWAYDDPFITYRYATNLASGFGFVYNPGEHVLSTTTPLFTILLMSLSFVWPSIPSLANVIGVISLLTGALFLWDLANSWNVPMVGWVGLLLYPTFPLLVMTIGSETPLYLALCLGAFAFYARGSYRLTAVLAALALLTRPDGVLLAVVLGVDYLVRFIYIRPRQVAAAYLNQSQDTSQFDACSAELSQPCARRVPWGAVMIFLSLSIPWFVYAWMNFGSPFPATMAARQFQGSMAISERFAPGLLTIARQYSTRWHYWLQLILSTAGLVYLALRAPRWVLLISWTAIYFLGYSMLGVSRYFWYYAPLVPGFVVLVGLGFEGLSRLAGLKLNLEEGEYLKRNYRNLRGWMALLTIGVLSALFIAQIVHLDQIQASPDARYPVYREVGEWLRANTDPGTKVATLEVGIIGYYSHKHMIDFAGLIQPQVAPQLSVHTDYEDAALWALQAYQPEYIVLHDGVFPRVEQTYVEDRCTLAQRYIGANYAYARNISIYACNIN
jgi:hypothetical protein